MPELPEVETVCRGLAPHLIGRRVEMVTCYRPDLRYPLPDLSVLRGQTCHNINRRAKYLQFAFDDVLLVWHLGMSGCFRVADSCRGDDNARPARHEHVWLLFSGDVSLRYIDPRRFGYAGLLPKNGWQQHAWFKSRGPEPLNDAFDGKYLFSRCQGRKIAIKPLLMDASVVVGVGNIYACEALFRAAIHPTRAASRISRQRLNLLVFAVQEVLSEAIAAGGSTISDFAHVDGNPGYFSHGFRVYGRDGQRCLHCNSEIRRLLQSGRSTFYCPRCQR
ncbi:MAG: bifunctional DNA-formamidopyrimidine glycosylase/DNA-(apurinic or apyrimidinic site) lyase [Mariprofundaceae bacterium]|nr:bifunctional DNA-formamidopyrimidine glycosylase/DNA-(apurinic or apyrimidinic site) lyase [Mariprofundaceae bacterium]